VKQNDKIKYLLSLEITRQGDATWLA